MAAGECQCRKQQYSTKAKARHIASQQVKNSGEDLHAYKCPFDRRIWHIGHVPPPSVVKGSRDRLRDIVRRKQGQ